MYIPLDQLYNINNKLRVQPFLLAMPADIHLAIKAKNNCSEFTWVLLFSKV